MDSYLLLRQEYNSAYEKLSKKHYLVSAVRLGLVLGIAFLLYQAYYSDNRSYDYAAVFLAIGFFIFIRQSKSISWQKKLQKLLILTNEHEIKYLNGEQTPFQNGVEYIDSSHLHSFDLDIFGENSFYQNINRTATYIGGKTLAERLMTVLEQKEIEANQVAIQELSQKLKWRQYIHATGKIVEDTQGNYQKLVHWSNLEQVEISKFVLGLAYLVPVLFCVSAIGYFFFGVQVLEHVTTGLFLLNLTILLTQLPKIKPELLDSHKTFEILYTYSIIIEKIEQETFDSPKLNQLKAQLQTEGGSASAHIKQLSYLLSQLQNIQNGIGALLVNGPFLYHIHTLNKIFKWKKAHSAQITAWLDVIGEFETLNSIANFAYNNPNFVFPSLNNNLEIFFENLGHPLIPAEKRICNDLTFNSNPFIILTGSNMSGKSTFLRTMGLNMVLAGIGSPICATNANIHPLPVIVFMRQSDSLTDGESYFFAEVKRLKQILAKLKHTTCFVLLDEILKGTNSDDKQDGTIEVIKKIISYDAVGAIATHDLEVCQTTSDYPNKLINKCFEVDIIKDELVFDYKVRDGICQNKTATFLMRKEGVI